MVLRKIVRLSMEMNPSGKRKYFGSEMLSSLRSDEQHVYATSNRGNHKVSDLHEWRNAGPTVSTRDSVNLKSL